MKIKIIIFILILVAVLTATGFFFYKNNLYSREDVKVQILGPEEATLLDEIEYTVKYENNGNILIEQPRLIFEYPKYSILAEGETERLEKKLDDIYPGEEKTITFKARLLGKEGEIKTARATLSYQPKNLKARYDSGSALATVIKSVPIAFEFDLPSKIGTGKDVKFRLNYFSNANYPLSNLRCQIEYPQGFEFQASAPKALDKTNWDIGLLNKAQGGRIEISGKLSGEIREEKIFKAKLGIWQNGEFILLKEAVKGVEIVEPSLYISQEINNNPQYTANPGDQLHYEVFFRNIGEDALTNLFLTVKFEGGAFDFGTIKSNNGKFQVGDNSIVFDWKNISKLMFLDAGEEGSVEFWIDLKKDAVFAGNQDKNQIIKTSVSLGQAREEFITKVNSKLEIVQRGYFSDEVFGNSGPIPPQAGVATTYTIIWQAKNYSNDVRNVKIKASLPAGAQLTGKIFPEDTRLTFDSQSREIVWEIGDLEAGRGVLNQAPNVSFQISFVPNSSQRGQSPEIIGEAVISGEDLFTGAVSAFSAPIVTTALPDDPTMAGKGIVQ